MEKVRQLSLIQSMTILIISDSLKKDYTALANSYIRAFAGLGHSCEVAAFDINIRFFRVLYMISPGLVKLYMNRQQDYIVSEACKSKYDVIFAIKGFYLFPESVRRIRESGKKVICFHPDDPFNHEFAASNTFVRNAIKEYSAYFIWSKKLVSKIEQAGSQNVFYLPFAVDKNIIKKNSSQSNEKTVYAHDVSFIGNADDKRRNVLTEVGAALKGWKGNKAVYGLGWNQQSAFQSYDSVQAEKYLNVMYATKVNLNILRPQNKGAHNMRTFEIPATGGFMLHEYSEEAAEFFVEGVEADFFRSAEDCADKIKYYSENDEERERIAAAGFARTQSSGYSYENVMEQLLEYVQMIG